MANTGSTAETICSAPAREKEEAIFYLCFSAFPTEVEKSFERSVWGWGSGSFAVWFQCLSTGTYSFPSCSINLGRYLCQWAAEGIEWALKPHSVACSGWASPAILIPWHTGQLLLPAALARPSAMLGLGFEEQPHPLPPSLMQRWCRRMEDWAIPCPTCLWLYPQICQHTSYGRAHNELHLEFYVNYEEAEQHKSI